MKQLALEEFQGFGAGDIVQIAQHHHDRLRIASQQVGREALHNFRLDVSLLLGVIRLSADL